MATGRTVRVHAERLGGWVERFETRHGVAVRRWDEDSQELLLNSPDGAEAGCGNEWDPMASADLETLAIHILRPRLVGVILARRGAHVIGVVNDFEVIRSRTSGHYVQGRTKKGGWSQQRYARRRANQADRAWADATEDAIELLGDQRLDALVCAGDRAGLAQICADPHLAAAVAVRTAHRLQIPEPRRRVLDEVVVQLAEAPIRLNQLA